VSVASKYGTDLTQFTCVVVEDMRNMLDSFKQDMNSSLPRQVRALVQQIQGETQGKRVEGSPSTFNTGGISSQGNQWTLANVSQPNPGVHLNLQQTFYQTLAYGPNMSPMGNGVPQGLVLDVLFPEHRPLPHQMLC
jgi:hypothetical protein